MNEEPKKFYAERDPLSLEPHYSAHVSAMTSEGLHAKSAIAAELAYRDSYIEELESERDRGFEFLERWQKWAKDVMRGLGEIDEMTLPDDTRTREVVSKVIAERTDLRNLVEQMRQWIDDNGMVNDKAFDELAPIALKLHELHFPPAKKKS